MYYMLTVHSVHKDFPGQLIYQETQRFYPVESDKIQVAPKESFLLSAKTKGAQGSLFGAVDHFFRSHTSGVFDIASFPASNASALVSKVPAARNMIIRSFSNFFSHQLHKNGQDNIQEIYNINLHLATRDRRSSNFKDAGK